MGFCHPGHPEVHVKTSKEKGNAGASAGGEIESRAQFTLAAAFREF